MTQKRAAATTIAFTIPTRSRVKLEIFDVNGNLVRTLIDDLVDGGYRKVVWNGKNNSGKHVVSGIYFYRLTTDKKVISKKAILLR